MTTTGAFISLPVRAAPRKASFSGILSVVRSVGSFPPLSAAGMVTVPYMLSPTFQSDSVTASSCFSSTCSKRFRAMCASFDRHVGKPALARATALHQAAEAVAAAPDCRHERRYPEKPDRLGERQCRVVELALVARLTNDGESLIEFLGCLHRGETRARQAIREHHRLDMKSG